MTKHDLLQVLRQTSFYLEEISEGDLKRGFLKDCEVSTADTDIFIDSNIPTNFHAEIGSNTYFVINRRWIELTFSLVKDSRLWRDQSTKEKKADISKFLKGAYLSHMIEIIPGISRSFAAMVPLLCRQYAEEIYDYAKIYRYHVDNPTNCLEDSVASEMIVSLAYMHEIGHATISYPTEINADVISQMHSMYRASKNEFYAEAWKSGMRIGDDPSYGINWVDIYLKRQTSFDDRLRISLSRMNSFTDERVAQEVHADMYMCARAFKNYINNFSFKDYNDYCYKEALVCEVILSMIIANNWIGIHTHFALNRYELRAEEAIKMRMLSDGRLYNALEYIYKLIGDNWREKNYSQEYHKEENEHVSTMKHYLDNAVQITQFYYWLADDFVDEVLKLLQAQLTALGHVSKEEISDDMWRGVMKGAVEVSRNIQL